MYFLYNILNKTYFWCPHWRGFIDSRISSFFFLVILGLWGSKLFMECLDWAFYFYEKRVTLDSDVGSYIPLYYKICAHFDNLDALIKRNNNCRYVCTLCSIFKIHLCKHYIFFGNFGTLIWDYCNNSTAYMIYKIYI